LQGRVAWPSRKKDAFVLNGPLSYLSGRGLPSGDVAAENLINDQSYPAKATTSGCTTHVTWGKEDLPIDWKAVTLSDDGTPSMLMISMGPTQDFALRFGNPAALRTARSVAAHLITACPQNHGR